MDAKKAGAIYYVTRDPSHAGNWVEEWGWYEKTMPIEEFQNCKNFETLCHLLIADLPITSLPQNLKVGMTFCLIGTKVTSLPENLEVGMDLDLQGAPQIDTLPESLKVGKSLFLKGTKIKSLPSSLKTAVMLDIRETQVTTLPDNFEVKYGLFVGDTPITSLPKGLKVGGWLQISGTGITSLPNDLEASRIVVEDSEKIECSPELKRKILNVNETHFKNGG